MADCGDQSAYVILTSPSIYDQLYQYCTYLTLFFIARTCKGARDAAMDFLSHTFSIRYAAQITQFFPHPGDVNNFRQLQADLEFLVFGLQAMRLLDRSVGPVSCLNIYIKEENIRLLAEWLKARSYHFVPDQKSPSGLTFGQALEKMFVRGHPGAWEDQRYTLFNDTRVALYFEKHHTSKDVGWPLARNSRAEAIVEIVVIRGSPLRAILKCHEGKNS